MLEFNFTPFPTLVTGRLKLRQMSLADSGDHFLLRTNDAVLTYLDRPKETLERTDEVLRDIIGGVEKNESIIWAITLKDDPKLIGTAGFWRATRAHHRAEIGYMLLPEYWQSGIMSEAIRPVLKYGFEKMKLHSVEANVNPENAASRRLLEKFGFRQEAYFTENYHHDGKFLDSVIYSLLLPWFQP